MLYEFIEKNRMGRYLDRHLVLLADTLMVLFASVCSILFVEVLTFQSYTLAEVLLWIAGSVSASLFSFVIFGTYKSIVRNSSFYEAWTLLRAVAVKGMVLLALISAANVYYWSSFPHFIATLLLDMSLSFIFLMTDRVVVVVAYDIMRQRNRARRAAATIMVYGIHENSYTFVQAHGADYNVVGYLRRGKSRRKFRLGEHRVYEFSDKTRLMQVLDMNMVDTLVFTSQADINREEDCLLPLCREQKIRTMFAPPMSELKRDAGRLPLKPREISIEDVLERPEVKISMDVITQFFREKTILVTGAAGSIGSELCRLLSTFGVRQLVLFDNAETPMHNLRLELEDTYPGLSFVPVIGDVRMRATVEDVFRRYRPEVVFHAAAYKHVPLMEENPLEAFRANVTGSRNVADMCLEYGTGKIVMISTDKAVNPTNIMGCTKRLAEIYVQSLAKAVEQGRKQGRTQFVTTRFGNVLGSNGSVIPRFREQIAKGGPVTVTHPEITRFFMTIPEACRLVMEAAMLGRDNRIFIFDMGKSVRIAHLAERMIELAGFEPGKDIMIEYTGLRPGEKLYEEVLASEENTLPTDHESIRIARVREYEYDDVVGEIDRLTRLCDEGDVPGLVRGMKRMVPEFKSQNSVFEKFDTEPAEPHEGAAGVKTGCA